MHLRDERAAAAARKGYRRSYNCFYLEDSDTGEPQKHCRSVAEPALACLGLAGSQ
jgi:hypothetical protein